MGAKRPGFVESGRWGKAHSYLIYNERKCAHCSVLEDEFHFVLTCPLYLDLRKNCISKYYWSRPNMFKFLELLNCSNTGRIRKLSCFVFHAFNLPGFNCWFSFAPVLQWCCATRQGSPGVGRKTFLPSPHLCFIIVFICDLFVSRDDPLMS